MLLYKSKTILVVICIFVIAKIFMASSMSLNSKEKGYGSHIFWHSIYGGLALQPDIREKYTDERVLNFNNNNARYDVFCNSNSFTKDIELGKLKIYKLRTLLCYHPNVTNILLDIRDYFLYPQNDQDSYSAALRWLYKHGNNEYEIFNFNPVENINYYESFSLFNTHTNKYTNAQINRSTNDVKSGRKFKFLSDMNWIKYDEILSDVVKDVVISQPFKVLESTFILKPIRFLYMYFRYYLTVDIVSFILTIITFIYCVFILRRNSVINMKNYFRILLLILLFSMILPLVVYPEPFTICDQSLILSMCIYCFLIGLLSVYSRKLLFRFDQNSN